MKKLVITFDRSWERNLTTCVICSLSGRYMLSILYLFFYFFVCLFLFLFLLLAFSIVHTHTLSPKASEEIALPKFNIVFTLEFLVVCFFSLKKKKHRKFFRPFRMFFLFGILNFREFLFHSGLFFPFLFAIY